MHNLPLLKKLEDFWSQVSPDYAPQNRFFCPGRVNLIGEHIDYNGGYVFPIAISQGIYCFYKELPDTTVILYSLNFQEDPVVTDINKIQSSELKSTSKWYKYPLGALELLREEKIPLKGGMYVFGSDLPIGSGVSSSAAIEVLTLFVNLHSINCTDMDRVKLALMAQKTEREKVGVMCGIMDQFCVANAKKGTALLLNCENLDCRYVPFLLKDHSLVIMNTNKPRSLVESKYNQRRRECEEALQVLNQKYNFANLCSANIVAIENELKYDPILLKRARHVVTEQKRVLSAVDYLSNGEMEKFSTLMTESHVSLREDYEVTGKELDIIVELALASPYCLGARMTGAGFGGCAIALVKRNHEQEFEESIKEKYLAGTDYHAEFLYSEAQDGVAII